MPHSQNPSARVALASREPVARHILRVAIIGCASIAAAARVASGAPPVPWEYSPYRIEVVVAVDPRVPLAPSTASDLAEDLAARASGAARGVWLVTARSATPTWRHRVERLASLGLADLPSDVQQKLDALDKVLLLGIREAPEGWNVVARELDVATGEGGPLVSVPARDMPGLLPAAHRAMQLAFTPLARIESAAATSATLSLRGGLLPGREAVPGMIGEGLVFRPILVTGGSEAEPSERTGQLIPWTYLEPTRTDSARVDCRVLTALAGEIVPPYHPRRSRLALGGRPAPGGTTLRVVRQDDPAQGVRGLAVDRESGPSQRVGLTGDDGRLLIPSQNASAEATADETSAIVWLLVRSGDHTLARIPGVPGLVPEVVLAVPDDSPRLAVETELAALEDSVLDFVAERESLLARTLQARAANDLELPALVEHVRSLPDPKQLADRLAQIEPRASALPPEGKEALTSRLAAVRKVLDQLAAEKPESRLEEPKAPEGTPEP
jgi:hypothetical protein